MISSLQAFIEPCNYIERGIILYINRGKLFSEENSRPLLVKHSIIDDTIKINETSKCIGNNLIVMYV
jgi:hypothetical protein